MIVALLILHGLLAVGLLGAITHQGVSLLGQANPARGGFVSRYRGTHARAFTVPITGLYIASLALGACIYPSYRLNVRSSFEEMALGWAVGLFELKEHFGAIGLALLPAYVWVWRDCATETHQRDRTALTWILTFIVWWDFLVGHVLNNIRGLP